MSDDKTTPDDAVCYIFMWRVCDETGCSKPLRYEEAKLAVQQSDSKWLRLIPA